MLTSIYLADDVNAIFVCGDLNGRIGNLKDTVTALDTVPDRQVLDTVINQHGHSLVEFLQETAMCMVNGRVTPEHNDFTFIANRGKSVVDYIY